MKFHRRVSLVVFALLAWAGPALADFPGPSDSWRDPVPFPDVYRDGYVLVLWNANYTDADLAKIFDRIIQSRATHVSIPLFGCQTDIHSADPGSCEVASRDRVVHMAELAQARKLDVSFLPIMTTQKWEWRGDFEPTDVDGWFKAYTNWIVGVAQLEEKLGMKELVVGTEFVKLYQYEDQWRQVLAAVRDVYHGPLVITVNWNDLEHGFWDATDAIGVSSYFPLSETADPAQDELDASWSALRASLLDISHKWSRPLHVTELGYPSEADAAHIPWTYDPNTAKPDAAIQARCFTAFTNAWAGDQNLMRVSVWATSDPGDAFQNVGYEPLGKPAERILGDFFAARAPSLSRVAPRLAGAPRH